MNVQQKFYDFMIQSGKYKKTATEYTRYIERLSQHSGEDIFSISCADDLEPLVKRYDSGGLTTMKGTSIRAGPGPRLSSSLLPTSR